MLTALSDNKQNTMEDSNQGNGNGETEKLKRLEERRLSTGRRELHDDVEHLRREVYEQQKKNKKVYDQLIAKNRHFGYRLLERSGKDNRYILVKQHEALLQEQSFLLKELTKVECLTQIIHPQGDPFLFLLDVWKREGPAALSSDERIEKINKNINFMKTSLKDIAYRTSSDTFEASTGFIMQSREYRELSDKYQAALGKIEAMAQEMAENNRLHEDQISQLRKKNEELQSEKAQIQSKSKYYEDKSKQLITTVSALSQDLLDKERKIHEMRIHSTRSDRQLGETSSRGSASALSSHNTSINTQDEKENILAELNNDEQNHPLPTSNKKIKPGKAREFLFSDIKARELFPDSPAESLQDKSFRFIRRK